MTPDRDLDAEVAHAESLLETDSERSHALVQEIGARITRDEHPDLRARLAILRSRLLRRRGDHFHALSIVRAAQLEWRTVEDPIRNHQLTLEATESLINVGELATATTLIEKQVTELSSVLAIDGSPRTVRVHAHGELNLGRAATGLGHHEEGIRHYDLAAGLYQTVGDRHGAALCRHGRGRAFLALGMTHRAAEELTEAYRGLHAVGRVIDAHRVLIDAAHTLVGRGRLGAGIELLHRCRDLLGDEILPPDRARIHLELGTAQLRAGQPREALEQAQRALDGFLPMGMAMWSGRAELLRADVALAQQDREVATHALNGAEQLFTECGANQLLRRVWARRAGIAADDGRTEEARELWERTLAGVDQGRPALSTGYAHLALARLSESATAAHHLAAASRIAFTLNAQPLQLALRLHQARAQVDDGHTGTAIELLRASQTEIQRIESTHPEARADVNYRTAADRSQDLLISLLLAQGTHTSMVEAWRCAAAGKHRSARRRAEPTTAWSPGPADPTPDDGPEWPISPAGLRALMLTEATASSPLPPWDRIAVPEGPVLEFHVLESDIAAFVIREGHVHARMLPGAAASSRTSLDAWQQQVSLRSLGSMGRSFLPDDERHEDTLLASLYDVLLAPLEDLLDGEDEEWHLVLHRHLYAVPFEAMLGPERDSFGGTMPTVAFRTMASGPPRPLPHTPFHGPLVLAVPDGEAPLIQEEAAKVVGRLGGAEMYVGADATRARLLDGAAGRSVVHVACHGVFSERNPGHSALRLADGWVTAQDLQSADLSGSLLVLSACASGMTSGDAVGPIGLAWACLNAGARGVVAAMWPVDDAMTRTFMDLFYTRLTTEPTVAAALESTRAELRVDHPDRHDWAAFRFFAEPMDQTGC